MDRAQMTDLTAYFYSGAAILDKVAAWAYVVANPQAVLDHLASLEQAYEQIIDLDAEGKITAGPADMSEENLERLKHIRRLLQPGLDSREARDAAQEVYALAERCVQGLKQAR